MKKFINKALELLRFIIQLIFNYCYDFIFYLRHSRSIKKKQSRNAKQLIGEIIKISHSLEKGLAFRKVKEGYGVDKAVLLCDLLIIYHKKYGYNEYFEYGLKLLKIYLSTNEMYLNRGVKAKIEKCILKLTYTYDNVVAGVKEVPVLKLEMKDFKAFVAARTSVRQFSKENVPRDLLKEAMSVAQLAPSACNRQSIKVHVVEGGVLMEDALKFQSGNRGFGHEFNKLLIITSDIFCYGSAKERNLSYVDGGIFTMNLLLSLHALGIGSCPLNWAVDYQQEIGLKKVIKIPKNERVVVMVGIGYPEDGLKVAHSWRRPLAHVLNFHNQGSSE